MKIISFLVVMFVGGVCLASDFHMDTMVTYEKCRKDFAIKQCTSYPNKYRCVKFYKDGQQYVTWDEIFGASGERIKVLVQKINRRNTLIWRNHCIALPYDLSKTEMDFSPFDKKMFSQPVQDMEKVKTIVVDLKQLAWGAYYGNNLIKWGPANGGIGKCKETGKMTCKTPTGSWKIYEIKRGFQRSDLYPVDCKNKKICGHPYFNVIKFGPRYEALHGEKDGHVSGANISHGCVRIFKNDSKWLVDFVEKGTTVLVYNY